MTLGNDTVRSIASDLRSRPTNRDVLDRAKRAIAQGDGSALLAVLLDLARTETLNDGTAIQKTMTLLESFADIDFAVAGLLMVKLAFVASDALVHHVSGAVELWVTDKCLAELAQLDESADRRAGNAWQQWAEMLEERCRKESGPGHRGK